MRCEERVIVQEVDPLTASLTRTPCPRVIRCALQNSLLANGAWFFAPVPHELPAEQVRSPVVLRQISQGQEGSAPLLMFQITFLSSITERGGKSPGVDLTAQNEMQGAQNDAKICLEMAQRQAQK